MIRIIKKKDKRPEWKIFEDENIADIKIEVFGKTRVDLLKNIVLSFSSIITDLENLREENKINFKIFFDNFENLVFDFINKLIFIKDTQFFIPKSAILEIKKNILYTTLKGQKISNNLPIKIDIKALTNHKFYVKKNNYWHTSLVFDI